MQKRTVKVVLQEYNQVCFEIGKLKYTREVMKSEIAQLCQKAFNLAMEHKKMVAENTGDEKTQKEVKTALERKKK